MIGAGAAVGLSVVAWCELKHRDELVWGTPAACASLFLLGAGKILTALIGKIWGGHPQLRWRREWRPSALAMRRWPRAAVAAGAVPKLLGVFSSGRAQLESERKANEGRTEGNSDLPRWHGAAQLQAAEALEAACRHTTALRPADGVATDAAPVEGAAATMDGARWGAVIEDPGGTNMAGWFKLKWLNGSAEIFQSRDLPPTAAAARRRIDESEDLQMRDFITSADLYAMRRRSWWKARRWWWWRSAAVVASPADLGLRGFSSWH